MPTVTYKEKTREIFSRFTGYVSGSYDTMTDLKPDEKLTSYNVDEHATLAGVEAVILEKLKRIGVSNFLHY